MGQQENNNSYPPGTIVFAKLKGYPWWPAKIEDERTVPAKVMKQKTKSRSPIWTVFFFGSKDYGFFGPDSIRPFNKADVEKDLKAKKFKTKDLERAIREALDPTWIDDDDEEEGKAAMEKRKSKDMTELTRKPTTLNKKSKIGKATGGQDTPSINKRGVNQDEQLEKVKRRKSMSQEQEDDLSNGHDRPSASPVAGLNKDHESPEFTRDFKRLYHLRHRLQKMMYEKEQVKERQSIKD
ncbi:hypothetical protein BC941DRAFT_434275 [Chlamydoabsidia padenii]|nr:hypothetical protein BC941DRAFT_434275 [Chlamydoabsidia padenii]